MTKFTDEELAQAALLLAHLEPGPPLSRELEAKLHADGARIAAELRHTTMRGGAMELDAGANDDDLRSRARPRSRTSRFATVAWFAAAAIAAGVVYQVRVPREPARLASAPPRTFPLQVRGADGASVATVDVIDGTSTIVLNVKRLPASPNARYQVWVSERGEKEAEAAGFFACDEACVDATWRVETRMASTKIQRVWITKSESEERALGAGTNIVATSAD